MAEEDDEAGASRAVRSQAEPGERGESPHGRCHPFCTHLLFLVPFMIRWDKKREARVEAFKERLRKIGLPEDNEEDDFVEEIDPSEESQMARVVLPRTNVLEASVQPASESQAMDFEKPVRPDSASNCGAKT